MDKEDAGDVKKKWWKCFSRRKIHPELSQEAIIGNGSIMQNTFAPIEKKILIIAGEASGDRHAADLVRELKACDPQLQFSGIGGDAMRQEGVQLLYHISQLAFLGLTEVIKHLPFIRKVTKTVQSELKNGAGAVILVDYPGFNLRVARIAREIGVPVVYYISPQLWAWGEKRVEKIRRYVDLMLVIFQFEKTFYEKHGITAHFVGHPLVEQLRIGKSEAEFRRQNSIPEDLPILALLPGSREMEVRNLLPVMVQAAGELRKAVRCVAVIGRASQLPQSLYDEYIPAGSDIRLVNSQTPLLMRYAYAAMVASGTATLETGYLQTPMVVLYSVSPLTYWLGRMLVKIDTIALANIVMGKKVVPELIQKDVSVEKVRAAVERFFSDPAYYRSVKEELKRIPALLGAEGASRRAAERIVAFLQSLGSGGSKK